MPAPLQVSPPARTVAARVRRLLPLLGLVLLGWVLSRMDLAAMGNALARVSAGTLALAAGFFACNLLVKAYRWQRLLQMQGIAIPLRVALAAFLSGQFYGQVTLGRAGEFLRVEALLERGVRLGSALASCTFDRLLDVFAVLAVGAVLAAWVVGDLSLSLAALAAMLVIAFLLGLGIELLGTPPQGFGDNFVQRGLTRLQGRPLLGKLASGLRELAEGMRPALRAGALVELSAFTAVAWLGYFAALWQLAEGMGLQLSRSLLTSTASFAALTALLPITVSGLGARELIYINVLSAQGVPKESAVVLSLLHLFVMSLCATALGLAGVLWRQRQRP